MQTSHETRLDLLGTCFAIRSDDPRLTDVVGELWEPFRSAGGHGDDHTVTITTTSDGWTIRFADGPVDPESDPWDLLDEIRYGMVQEAIDRADGIVALHAGVVSKEGVTLLLAGPSKAGKTTLTLALVRAGWSYRSDDLAPIDSSTGEVLPFPKPLSVRNKDDWPWVRKLWKAPAWLPDRAESILVPGPALGAAAPQTLIPTHLALIGYSPGGAPDLTEISVAEAAAECGRFVAQVGAPELAVLTSLCSRVSRARIAYPSSVDAVEALTGWSQKNLDR